MNNVEIEFETKVNADDMIDFKMYHNYHNISGIATLLVGIIFLIISIVSFGKTDMPYTLMLAFFGVFFTIYTPIGIRIKSVNQIKKNELFKEPIKYIVSSEKIKLQQKDISEEIRWDEVYKIKSTKKSLLLYVTAIRCNIIPYRDLGENKEEFIELAKSKLKPFQVKVKS